MKKIKVIAEAGVNHLNSLDRAKELIVAAAKAGADAIKFQTYTADELVVKHTPKFWNWKGDAHFKTQYDAYAALGGFSYGYYPELMACCEENQIEFMSTPFSFEAADYLNSIGMKAFKIASSDMSWLSFLEHVAKFQKPIYLSTGAATMDEIHQAVDTILDAGNGDIILLHCTLCYPTRNEDANLRVIQTLKTEFPGLTVGISDHTLGVQPSIIAAAAGAEVIEKHFTLDKTLPDSADHWLSVNPKELSEIVSGCRIVEGLLGSQYKDVLACEAETRKYDKRSLVAKQDIPAGTILTKEMLTAKRPGTGIWPKFLPIVVGKKALENIKADEIITWRIIG